MSYLSQEQINDGITSEKTLKPGENANVVLIEYTPFKYGLNKDKTMPQHKAKNADTGEELTFTGFAFHQTVSDLNDAITPGITVVNVKCLDNGTRYPDYELTVVAGEKSPAGAADAPF